MSAATAAAQRFLHATDAAITRLYLSAFRERGGLLLFIFHALFKNEQEISLNHVVPMEHITVAFLRRLIEYYLQCGYRFITPTELIGGLEPTGQYAMVTFDDGYFNNTLALPVLEQFKVPAVFSIATDYVCQGKSFWWDVLFREQRAAGASTPQFRRSLASLKALQTSQIESQLVSRFGSAALKPRSDIDRPFTPSELADFARHPRVHLANHTASHAILTNYSPAQVRAQIRGAQEMLNQITGITPSTIAYPNGAYNHDVLKACRELGLKVGFTVHPRKNSVPRSPDSPQLLRLGRFCPRGQVPLVTQCRTFRSDLQLYGLCRSWYLHLNGCPMS